MTSSQSTVLDLAIVLVLLVVVIKVGVPKMLATVFEWHQPPSLTWPNLWPQGKSDSATAWDSAPGDAGGGGSGGFR